jgi:hypothetical protein
MAFNNPKDSFSGGSAGVLYTDRRTFDIDRNVVKELNPSVQPYASFLMQNKMVDTTDPDFKIFEHRAQWIDMKAFVNQVTPPAWSSGTVTVTFDGVGEAGDTANISWVKPGYVVEVYANDGQNGFTGSKKATALITAVSGTSVTLKSISSSPTNLADNDIFYVVDQLAEEGSGSPDAWHDELTVVWNSCGIMKTPVEITGTLYNMALRGYSNELARLRAEKLMEHKALLNKRLLFGERVGGLGAPNHITGSNGRLVRSTMGALPAIEQYGDSNNKFVFSKATTGYDQINESLEKVFRFTNERGVKYGFGAPDVITYFTGTGTNSFLGNSSANIQVTSGMSRFGFPIRVIETGHGDLALTKDLALRGPYAGYLLILDPKNVGIRVFRDTKYETAIQDNDIDGIKDQYMSDIGLDISLIESHAYMKFTA